jgi:hypothetical protein
MSQGYEPRFQTPQMHASYARYAAKPASNGLALAALILGIAGCALSLIPVIGFFLCWPPALFAIIFGFIALRTANQNRGLRRNEALWGVICGFLPIPLMILVVAIAVAVSTATAPLVS